MSSTYTKEVMSEAVLTSKSWREVCLFFNLKPAAGSQGYLKVVAKNLGIDYSHFPGRAWKHNSCGKRTPLEKYYSGEIYTNSHNLKLKLIREGVKTDECERCHLSDWQGEKLPIHLDHIDGNHDNNALQNLQMLCPNCHSLKTRKDRKSRARGAMVTRLP